MDTSIPPCSSMATNADKRWPYKEYYLGEEDQKRRKSGYGENYWSGAESLEWYSGRFVRDTMHGEGEYRWRYKGLEGFVTYEGNFYGNRMHGCGVISYPDGRVFNGIFCNNVRWGPGVESHIHLREDVGLWRGNQLVRLAWRPQTPNVTLDLNSSPNANNCVEPYRTILTTRLQTIGEVNNAIELLKQSGATPMTAFEKWIKLYPKNCTDFSSQLCHNDIFDLEYYRKNTYNELEEVDTMPDPKEEANDDFSNTRTYYAWNNNEMMISMMKHCFKHEDQRHGTGIDLTTILTGFRSQYKHPGAHELDCRTLIMASYLGYITKVAQLVNENNVHPDVADHLGNTALMYAACGDHGDIVHFLVAAGANVNNFNDSCCTPLGVALMKVACGRKGIAPRELVQAVLPSSGISSKPTSLIENPSEWHKTRNFMQDDNKIAKKKTSKTNPGKLEKRKSSMNTITSRTSFMINFDLDDQFPEDYRNINAEFTIKVESLFSESIQGNRIPYIFEVIDMAKDMGGKVEETKHPEKNNKRKPSITKPIKENTKNSKDILWRSSEKEINSLSSADRAKTDMLSRNMSTIAQLLKDGADPRLVRCPQPALRIAAVSGSPDLVRLLVKHGADINEVYPEALNYTPLDIAISQPLTNVNLELIRAILESGARVDHRLEYQTDTEPNLQSVQGPTLLHVVLAKHTNEAEGEIRRQLLELLLEYNCNALIQFRGCSAVDVAMEKMELLDIFIKCPKIDLNAAINENNQSILTKMFSLEFFKTIPLSQFLATLTNLLLYGADPLLECQEADKKYTNIFVYSMKNVIEMGGVKPNDSDDEDGIKTDVKSQQSKAKSKSKLSKDKVNTPKPLAILNDYMQALNLVTECVRILHVRWIQAKLLKELIEVVQKFEHRHWNMILPEYRNKKACGLWLACPRTFEIWEILKAARKKKVTDRRVLKHLLCIVHFNSKRSKTSFKSPLTAEEKGLIDNEVLCFLNEQKIPKMMTSEQRYVTPELAVGAERKFQVCFECGLPFEENKIQCIFCKQVSFCSLECVKRSVEEERVIGCHPCSDKMKEKYFPTNDNRSLLSSQIINIKYILI